MIGRKRKKVVKYRGSKTHGCGAMKKRRGAGNRGGRGRAGSGKRGDAKKPSYWKETVGKIGFTSLVKKGKTMNVGHLDASIRTFVASGRAAEKSGSYTIDLGALGVGKLLGTGPVRHKLAITVAVASPRAIEKVEAAGGKVTVSGATAAPGSTHE